MRIEGGEAKELRRMMYVKGLGRWKEAKELGRGTKELLWKVIWKGWGGGGECTVMPPINRY